MRYLHWGPDAAAAPRALLVHGITSSAATMWELGTGLADAGWSVTAVDLPGHGASPPASSYRFSDVADDLHALVGDVDLYVGHSLGGAIGTVLLARHPSAARRAVLVDPVVESTGADPDAIPTQLLDDKDLTAAEVAATHPGWHPRTVETRVEATQNADVEAIRGWIAGNAPWDLLPEVAAVRVPVHVLVASDGSTVAADLPARVATVNPLWTFETVPGTTHSIHRDRPDVVLDRLLRG